MDSLLDQLSRDQIAFVEGEVAAGRSSDPITCVKELVSEAINFRQRKLIDQKLLEALDEYERGECKEWTAAERKVLLATAKSNK